MVAIYYSSLALYHAHLHLVHSLVAVFILICNQYVFVFTHLCSFGLIHIGSYLHRAQP